MYSVFLAKLYSIFYIKQECFIVVRATQSLVISNDIIWDKKSQTPSDIIREHQTDIGPGTN